MIYFKTEKNKNGWDKVKLTLKEAVLEIDKWFRDIYQFDIVITETVSTMEDDIILERTSASHREGRAIDIRTKKMTEDMINSFIKKFSYLDDTIGAVSVSDGTRRFILYKPHGSGPHFHLQIGRDIA